MKRSRAKGRNVLEQLAADVGGKITEATRLPDGSGFAVMSLPLPRDHWLTANPEGFNVPPMPWRCGSGEMRAELAQAIQAAGRYALRAATMNGKEMDFDPDALLQNLVVGLLGYYTADGRSSDAWANPKPLPAKIIMGPRS